MPCRRHYCLARLVMRQSNLMCLSTNDSARRVMVERFVHQVVVVFVVVAGLLVTLPSLVFFFLGSVAAHKRHGPVAAQKSDTKESATLPAGVDRGASLLLLIDNQGYRQHQLVPVRIGRFGVGSYNKTRVSCFCLCPISTCPHWRMSRWQGPLVGFVVAKHVV